MVLADRTRKILEINHAHIRKELTDGSHPAAERTFELINNVTLDRTSDYWEIRAVLALLSDDAEDFSHSVEAGSEQVDWNASRLQHLGQAAIEREYRIGQWLNKLPFIGKRRLRRRLAHDALLSSVLQEQS